MEIIDFGVCRLSLIPVRSNASGKAEQVTQLLFGDHYEVLNETKDREWIYIRTCYDLYEGWIDRKQHHTISKDYFEYLNQAELKITTDICSNILYNKSSLSILMGSIIPISSAELFKMEEQFAFNGEAKNQGQKREFDFLKNIAGRYLHAPYQAGGKSPFGIDNSGLVQMIFKICGYKLLRDTKQQAAQGRTVPSLEESQPGDMAFFKDTDNQIVHVGIIYPDFQILHAHGRVRVDKLNEKGILDADTGNLTHRLDSIKKVMT